MTEFAVRIERIDSDAVLVLAGEVDLATSPRVRDAVIDALAAEPPARLVVDLSDVSFLDSTGIGALVAGRNKAAALGVPFVVRNPQRMVHRVLDIAGLLDVLDVEMGLDTHGE